MPDENKLVWGGEIAGSARNHGRREIPCSADTSPVSGVRWIPPEPEHRTGAQRTRCARNDSTPASARAIVLVAVLGFGVACAGCSHKSTAEGDERGGGADAVAEVTLTQVTRRDISQTLTFTGTIAAPPNRDVRVSSLVAGRVAEMHAAEGDHVAAGQLVARIDDRPVRDQLQQAEAAAAVVRANLENAKLARARNENLVQRGIAARKDLEDARKEESVAEASLRQAEATLALARLQLSRTEVKSPLTGTVVKRLVSVGEQVDGTAAQPIFEVADLSEVELIGSVPSIHLSKLRVNQKLTLTSEAFPGNTLSGRIVAISPAVDPATNAGAVRIRMANPSRALRLGMFLTAQTPVETHKNALGIPPQAIYRGPQGRPRIYRVEGETATAVEVKTGIESLERVELLSGAEAGQNIILTGGYGLGDKAKVSVKAEAKP